MRAWPTQDLPQQFHLDFAVDDLDEAEALLLKLGAAKPETSSAPGSHHLPFETRI